ncbi:MAG: TolC family protein [Acidobacteriaceae bacterium]|jgi:cobalt-zinc-cadmium efflux system outer membrane protein
MSAQAKGFFLLLSVALLASSAGGQTAKTAVRISLDEAIQLAVQHNHVQEAARNTILQSEAEETTANLRPNPQLTVDWEYLPFFTPSSFTLDYLHDSSEADFGVSYLFERGHKRQRRLQAQKDITAVTRSQVADSERQLIFQVSTLFFNAQLAESTLDLAQQDVKSFQQTVDVSEHEFKVGGISENDYLKIQVQLLEYQSDLEQARVAREQALSDLRQLLGYESVAADYDVEASFEYRPIKLELEDLQLKALQNRPDLRAAKQGVTAAGSQFALAKADGKQDVTGAFTYSHVNSINTGTVLMSVPLPFFNRNQGEILRTKLAITQAEQLQLAANGQVLTDVKDAYEGFQSNDRVVQLYLTRYLAVAQKSRDISDYSYHRGATALLDFLDSERTYRSVQLAYRQSLAAYLLALEQVREAVGSRNLP